MKKILLSLLISAGLFSGVYGQGSPCRYTIPVLKNDVRISTFSLINAEKMNIVLIVGSSAAFTGDIKVSTITAILINGTSAYMYSVTAGSVTAVNGSFIYLKGSSATFTGDVSISTLYVYNIVAGTITYNEIVGTNTVTDYISAFLNNNVTFLDPLYTGNYFISNTSSVVTNELFIKGTNIIVTIQNSTTPIAALIQGATTPIAALIQGATTPITPLIQSTMTAMIEVFRGSMTIIENDIQAIKTSTYTQQNWYVNPGTCTLNTGNFAVFNSSSVNCNELYVSSIHGRSPIMIMNPIILDNFSVLPSTITFFSEGWAVHMTTYPSDSGWINKNIKISFFDDERYVRFHQNSVGDTSKHIITNFDSIETESTQPDTYIIAHELHSRSHIHTPKISFELPGASTASHNVEIISFSDIQKLEYRSVYHSFISTTVIYVTIGISTPTKNQALEVYGNIDSTGTIIARNFIGDISECTGAETSSAAWYCDGTTQWNLNSGNVGIGTTEPRSKLDIQNTIYLGTTGTANGVINSDDSIYINVDANNNDYAQNIIFGIGRSSETGGSDIMRIQRNIDGTNRVGIGTVPSNQLDVNGSVAIGSYAGSYTAPSNSLIVSSNVGIGTTAPTAKLDVAGLIVSTSLIVNGVSLNTSIANSTSPINNLIMSTMTTMTEVFRATSTILNDRVTILENAAPAGGAGMTTFYMLLGTNGGAYNTTTFNDVSEAVIPVPVDFYITGVQGYCMISSTGSTFFELDTSTATDGFNIATTVATGIEVSSNTQYGTLTAIPTYKVPAGNCVGLKIYEINAVSIPAIVGIMVRYWRNQ